MSERRRAWRWRAFGADASPPSISPERSITPGQGQGQGRALTTHPTGCHTTGHRGLPHGRAASLAAASALPNGVLWCCPASTRAGWAINPRTDAGAQADARSFQTPAAAGDASFDDAAWDALPSRQPEPDPPQPPAPRPSPSTGRCAPRTPCRGQLRQLSSSANDHFSFPSATATLKDRQLAYGGAFLNTSSIIDVHSRNGFGTVTCMHGGHQRKTKLQKKTGLVAAHWKARSADHFPGGPSGGPAEPDHCRVPPYTAKDGSSPKINRGGRRRRLYSCSDILSTRRDAREAEATRRGR